MLVDAQAVLGSVCKGRSSSMSLKRGIMIVAALQLAGDVHLKLVYVPSEDNPADAPSRGVVRRWRRIPTCIAKGKRQLAARDGRRKSEYRRVANDRQRKRMLRHVNSKFGKVMEHFIAEQQEQIGHLAAEARERITALQEEIAGLSYVI